MIITTASSCNTEIPMLLNPKVSYQQHHEPGEKICYVSDADKHDVVVKTSREMISFPCDNSCIASECENDDVLEDSISKVEESRSCCQDDASSSSSRSTTATTDNDEPESNCDDTTASSNASREDFCDHSDPPPGNAAIVDASLSPNRKAVVEEESCRHDDEWVWNQTQRMQRYHEMLDNMYYYLDSDDYDDHNNYLEDYDKEYDEELTSIVFLTTTTSNENLDGDQQQHPRIIAIPVDSGIL